MKKIYLIAVMLISISAIAQNENVGIGTVNPEKSAVLDVNSTSKGFLTPRMTLKQRDAIANPAQGLLVYQTDLVSGFYFFDGKTWKPFVGNTDALAVADANNWGLQGNSGTTDNEYVGTTDNRPLIFRINTVGNTQWNEKMRLTSTGLGIGGISPTEALHVNGNIKSTNNIEGNLRSAFSRTYLIGKDNVGYHWFASSPSVSEPNNIMMGIKRDPVTDFVTDLYLAPAGSFALTVKAAGGKVQVGDVPTPDGYKLYVEGGILTEKLKVALKSSVADWADYVFEPEYKSNMRSLEEVEKFTLENKHLPNVPSAEDMVKNGLDVTKTSKMFMEKIEELTLYIIEINKRVKSLELENELLKKKQL